jgi:hypothetical protein
MWRSAEVYSEAGGKSMADLIKNVIGVFKGFIESGLEFKAEIVVPYHTEFTPLLGSFLVVEISKEHYLLGRITKFHPVGLMVGSDAEDYLAQMTRAGRSVPEDVKEAKLRYNVNVKLLGGLTLDGKGRIAYEPSMRRLPHLGASVGIPTEDTIRLVCALGIDPTEKAAVLGRLAFGSVVFDGDGKPDHQVPFNVQRLIGRRTYIFAHAGYGKTNLVKLLVTKLYATNPDVGCLIFDPEGEYALMDKKGRPGLADVPELQDKVVVYSDRRFPEKYSRFLAGDVHLNLSTVKSENVIKNCVPAQKWEQVWANAVRGLEEHEWGALVKLLDTEGYRADSGQIRDIVHNAASTTPPAIVNNLVPVVKKLHSKSSKMLEGLLWHLERGHVVIVDTSLMVLPQGRWVASMILNEIFQRNQASFTAGAAGKLLNVVAVIEEAQTVLSTERDAAESIFVEWAKEGRKYNLGSILVTQQPGAIPTELVSQGDNFFVFHLLSADDLIALRKANAHFSDDVLATILNEPIPGNAYMWSAPYQPFVLPLRIENFEDHAKHVGGPKGISTVTTAAEEFATRVPDLQKDLDRTIRALLETDNSVPIYVNVLIDGQPNPGQVAVKLWNLKLATGEALPQEAARVYCDHLPDGKKVVPDDTLFASLNRQDVHYAIMRSDRTHYLVVPSEAVKIRKSPRQESVQLQSSRNA